MRHLASVVIGATLLSACQAFDFDRIYPFAVAKKDEKITIGVAATPNLMLVVDKSGSMSSQVDPGCTGTCASRMDDLQSAMGSFLTQHGAAARMGLTFFPQGAQCSLATSTAVAIPNSDVPAVLQTTANTIHAAINGTAPSGGTPTANALAFAGQDPMLNDLTRENYILLLTDGEPNCNANADGNTCRCLTASCAGNPTQCLDDTATVATIEGLRNLQGIKTIVVGFGTDTAGGLAATTLQAMAVAGGYERPCPNGTDAECGSSTCNPATKTCTQAYFQASNASQLVAALQKVTDNFNRCEVSLTATPSNPEFVTVLVNSSVVERGPNAWDYLPPPEGDFGLGAVHLLGDLCTQAEASNAANPMEVVVQTLQTF